MWNRLYPEGLAEADQAGYPRRGGGRLSVPKASWQRDELSCAFSADDGKTWSKPVVIARLKNGNLSYPYVFERRPGELWITAGKARLVGQEKALLQP